MAKTKLENKNPPRRVDIRGQDHLLAYITPAEAQLLMDNGGSGEPGPMGIPTFIGGGGGAMGGFGGTKSSYDGPDNSGGRSEDRDASQAVKDIAADKQKEAAQDRAIEAEIANREAYQEKIGGITGGQANAMFGDATMAGKGFTSGDIDRMLGSASVSKAALSGILPELQRRAKRSSQFSTLGKIFSPATSVIKGIFGIPSGATSFDNLATLIGMPESTIMSGGLLGPDAVLGVPTGGTGAFGTPAHLSQGYLGTIGYTGMPNPDYTGPFANLVGGYQGVDRGGDGIVPTQTNPVTGDQQCPDGYVFDADIQACRVSAPLANIGDTVGGTGFDYEPGTYARMGLLDVAPEDLGGFASTYGTGFGTAPEYESANLAYRKPVGTMSGIFQDPYNLEGMTLLA